jgi:hypothetical protein
MRHPGNAARVVFPTDIQGPDIEPETYDNGTTNLRIRYAQHLLRDAKQRNALQQLVNGYKYLHPGRDATLEVSEELIIPALQFNVIVMSNK